MGPNQDITIARHFLLPYLDQDEPVYVDKAYIDRNEPRFLTPFKGRPETLTFQQLQWNAVHTRVRVIIENLNCRFKRFQCFKREWRHAFARHSIVFHAIAQLIQVDLDRHPLRRDRYETEEEFLGEDSE